VCGAPSGGIEKGLWDETLAFTELGDERIEVSVKV